MKENHIIGLLMIYASIQISLLWIFGGVGFDDFPDSRDYVEASKQILDPEEELNERTIFLLSTRPLSLLIPTFISKLVDIKTAFAFQSFLLIISCAPLMYYLSKKFFDDKKIAIFSSLFFLSSFPVLYWGFAVLTDIYVYFFFLLNTYLIINLFENDVINKKDTIIVSLVCSIGFLFKLHLIIPVLFFYLCLLSRGNGLSDNPEEKLVHSLVFGFTFILPLLVFELLASIILGYPLLTTFIHEILSNGDDGTIVIKPTMMAHQWPIYLLKITLIAFGIMIPLFLIGIYKSVFSGDGKNNTVFISFFLATFLSLLVIFTNGFGLTPRFIFLFFPIVLPCAASGFLCLSNLFFTQNQNLYAEISTAIIFIIYALVNNVVWFFSNSIRNYLGLSTEDLWGP